MDLPQITCKERLMFSDKEATLAVGTEVLGKEIEGPAIYKYSITTNAWSTGTKMNTHIFFFGSASLGEIGILSGGCDLYGNILSSAELYNSDTGKWEILPDLNTSRKMCSSVFMDGKFYALGGIAANRETRLTCGEKFDLKTRKWCEIPGMFMFHAQNGGYGMIKTPPLIAVVSDVLYVADHAQQELKRHVKDNNSWVTIGRLPEQAISMNGWGMAFRACGDSLIVISSQKLYRGGMIEVYSWVPDEGVPQWNLLTRRQSGNFVYNCNVMGC